MNQLWLTDDEMRFLRKSLHIRNQSLQFQINELTRDDVYSHRFNEICKEQSWCDEMILKLIPKEEQS